MLKKSLCNGALLRSDFRRCGVALGLYALLWLILLPLQLWRNWDLYHTAADCARCLYSGIAAAFFINLVFGLAFAMLLFGYLMNTRAVCGLHSLPITRGCQLRTHLQAAIGGAWAVNLVVFLLAVLAQSGCGVNWEASFYWLACSCVSFLLCFAMGTLCCMITGWLLAVPVLYGVMQCLAIVIYFTVECTRSLFFSTYVSTSLADSSLIYWLTPAARFLLCLPDAEDVRLAIPQDGMLTLWVYAIVAAALLVGSAILYRLRRSEVAGDALAFRPLYPAARWCIGLLGSFCPGTALAAILCATEELPLLLLCQVGMGALAFVLSEMLMAKTVRVLKKIRWELAALCLIVIALGVCMRLDVFGFESRVPDAAQVKSVEIWDCADSITLAEDEEIAAAIALQQHLVQQAEENAEEAIDWIYFSYTMDDGAVIKRSYPVTAADAGAFAPLEAYGLQQSE